MYTGGLVHLEYAAIFPQEDAFHAGQETHTVIIFLLPTEHMEAP